MQSRVYVTVGRPSVRLSVRQYVRPIDRQQQRWLVGLLLSAVLQAPVLSSKCGQRRVERRRIRLNTDLFKTN